MKESSLYLNMITVHCLAGKWLVKIYSMMKVEAFQLF